jgi:protein TonB
VTIQAYIDALGLRLNGSRWQRRRAIDEVRDHLLEAADRERQRGANAAAAEARAVARFGDVDRIAREFSAAWRGPSRGAALGFLWLSVATTCAASLAMTWHRVDPSPSLITLTEAQPNLKAAYRLLPPAPRTPAPRHRAIEKQIEQQPLETPIVQEPVPPPSPSIPLEQLVAFALPAAPGTIVSARAPSRVSPPQPLPVRNAVVRYPAEARWLAIEGDVRLRLHVDQAGHVDDAAIVRSLGHGLDEAALDLVRTLRFNPATNDDGHPVAAYVEWTVHCVRAHTPAMVAPIFGSEPHPLVTRRI